MLRPTKNNSKMLLHFNVLKQALPVRYISVPAYLNTFIPDKYQINLKVPPNYTGITFAAQR